MRRHLRRLGWIGCAFLIIGLFTLLVAIGAHDFERSIIGILFLASARYEYEVRTLEGKA